MNKSDCFKTKMSIMITSLLIVLITILLFFMDKSLEWGVEKIVICTVVNIWIFFIIPALRQSYLLNQDKGYAEWLKMGLQVGAGGICMPILFSPFYGVIYYFNVAKQKN